MAARALGLDEHALAPLPGAAGQTWAVGEHILRARPASALTIELAACAAARRVVPAPEVLDVVHLPAISAVLLRKLPGVSAGRFDHLSPARARRRGLACGRLHAVLAGLTAPPDVPLLSGLKTWPEAPPPPGDRLLHLDLHPFNVLVDDNDEVSGVIDWANAAAGHPDNDRARTSSIFGFDPAAVARRADPRWVALATGWAETGGFSHIAPDAMTWALQFMLGDLEPRYDPDKLSGVHGALTDLARAARAARKPRY